MKPKGRPPTYFFLCTLLIIPLFFILSNFKFINPPYNHIGLIFLISGLYLIYWPWALFKKHQTPEDFSQATSLVTQGPYKFSRHPMYLGGVIALIGLAIMSGNIIAFISPLLFFIIMNIIFIPFEEKKTEEDLGKIYLDYKNKVRRWL